MPLTVRRLNCEMLTRARHARRTPHRGAIRLPQLTGDFDEIVPISNDSERNNSYVGPFTQLKFQINLM